MFTWDSAPAPAPAPAPVPVGPLAKYISDDEAACIQEQSQIFERQWVHFQQGGPLRLPGEPGYEESRVIPQSWIDATNQARHNRLRQEIGIPLQPPQLQEEPSGSQPRHSNHVRQPVVHPDNVYGSRNPTQSEQMSSKEIRDMIEGVPATSEAPGNRPKSPPNKGKGKQHADYLVHNKVQEGGANLIKFLLRAAVSSADAKGEIPNVTRVREWHFRDLMRLPKALQEE